MIKHSIIRRVIIFGLLAILMVLGYFAWPKFCEKQNITQLEYKNAEYGFSVSLPATWMGYTVTNDEWSGDAIGDQLGETHYTTGTVVSIHNPKWTKEVMYQDIPIMIFTLNQWEELQQEKFHIGAAPIPPSELGRNAKYVFALPARYNFAFPLGFEEVDQIIQGKPLKTFGPK